ncbi:MAG TPA: futalosine hydrolase [Phnomibacter sp.]|nr:futalosine hydrolase [Phnomibacter sp.]
MKILLVSATQLEIQEYLLSAPHHDILITGVGLHHAIYELTDQLHGHHYDLVIQAGVAGAFEGSGLNMGDVVAVKQDAFGDAGSFEKEKFLSLLSLGLTTDKEWMINQNSLLGKLKIPQVKSITINTITDYMPFVNALQQKWKADIESMEGAALHFVCAKKNVPYLQLRAISNFVGERDKNKWLLATAIGNLNGALKALIGSLS